MLNQGYAKDGGGAIASFGSLSLDHVRVSDILVADSDGVFIGSIERAAAEACLASRRG